MKVELSFDDLQRLIDVAQSSDYYDDASDRIVKLLLEQVPELIGRAEWLEMSTLSHRKACAYAIDHRRRCNCDHTYDRD